ncbi:YiaA/YiaB family inner membrane protein [Enterovirga sp.]|uniref:YiaA/YiaB family inner membrane protein n=1 Tax=Enterovirga sp. TaxID=2026350 RepID=UPI002C9C86DB|nr:YiaA/YiaB family inner membrane protein [Enterovirga sp.]HMO28808.1 YiaA/YiaB family inner membrane protein [Enterovirga sp.]
MTPQMPHTPAWKTFTYVSFMLSVGMMAVGVFFLPADIWIKGYLAMATVFMVGTTFTLAKTLRDEHEASRLINKIEDAAAERVLREATPGRI